MCISLLEVVDVVSGLLVVDLEIFVMLLEMVGFMVEVGMTLSDVGIRVGALVLVLLP